jgi:hypothetical protein
VVADLDLLLTVDLLRGQAAVARKRARVLQLEHPEAVAALGVQPQVPVDPAQRLLARERPRVVAHDQGIAEHGCRLVEIGVGERPEEQTLGLEHRRTVTGVSLSAARESLPPCCCSTSA